MIDAGFYDNGEVWMSSLLAPFQNRKYASLAAPQTLTGNGVRTWTPALETGHDRTMPHAPHYRRVRLMAELARQETLGSATGVPERGEPIEMLLNMGPQHPSTHGVFRLVLWVDGEKVVRAEPHIGYLHRGSEKLCEGEQYHQIITLFDRLDYVANFNNELVYCQAVEKLMGLTVPERAEYVRVILCELNRIASHLLFVATMGLDAGAMTPSMFCFRGRERVQTLFEAVSGARMMHNYFRIGGIKEDLPDNFEQLMPTCSRCCGKTWKNRTGC